MKDSDVFKTGFSTDSVYYEFLRMPFGLKNSGASFERMMNKCLKDLIGKGVFVYVDNVVIYAKTLAEHDRLVTLVMERLRRARLMLQVEKSEFLKRRVSYLGHLISERGLEVDPKKIEAVRNFPIPSTQKNVREFIGLATYYSRFIKNFADIARPLTALLKKDAVLVWSLEVDEAFNILKDLLCSAPVLQFPNFDLEFIISTDASKVGLGGILSQGKLGNDASIAYASRVLQGAELNYDTYEREALAINYSDKQFRHCL